MKRHQNAALPSRNIEIPSKKQSSCVGNSSHSIFSSNKTPLTIGLPPISAPTLRIKPKESLIDKLPTKKDLNLRLPTIHHDLKNISEEIAVEQRLSRLSTTQAGLERHLDIDSSLFGHNSSQEDSDENEENIHFQSLHRSHDKPEATIRQHKEDLDLSLDKIRAKSLSSHSKPAAEFSSVAKAWHRAMGDTTLSLEAVEAMLDLAEQQQKKQAEPIQKKPKPGPNRSPSLKFDRKNEPSQYSQKHPPRAHYPKKEFTHSHQKKELSCSPAPILSLSDSESSSLFNTCDVIEPLKSNTDVSKLHYPSSLSSTLLPIRGGSRASNRISAINECDDDPLADDTFLSTPIVAPKPRSKPTHTTVGAPQLSAAPYWLSSLQYPLATTPPTRSFCPSIAPSLPCSDVFSFRIGPLSATQHRAVPLVVQQLHSAMISLTRPILKQVVIDSSRLQIDVDQAPCFVDGSNGIHDRCLELEASTNRITSYPSCLGLFQSITRYEQLQSNEGKNVMARSLPCLPTDGLWPSISSCRAHRHSLDMFLQVEISEPQIATSSDNFSDRFLRDSLLKAPSQHSNSLWQSCLNTHPDVFLSREFASISFIHSPHQALPNLGQICAEIIHQHPHSSQYMSPIGTSDLFISTQLSLSLSISNLCLDLSLPGSSSPLLAAFSPVWISASNITRLFDISNVLPLANTPSIKSYADIQHYSTDIPSLVTALNVTPHNALLCPSRFPVALDVTSNLIYQSNLARYPALSQCRTPSLSYFLGPSSASTCSVSLHFLGNPFDISSQDLQDQDGPNENLQLFEIISADSSHKLVEIASLICHKPIFVPTVPIQPLPFFEPLFNCKQQQHSSHLPSEMLFKSILSTQSSPSELCPLVCVDFPVLQHDHDLASYHSLFLSDISQSFPPWTDSRAPNWKNLFPPLDSAFCAQLDVFPIHSLQPRNILPFRIDHPPISLLSRTQTSQQLYSTPFSIQCTLDSYSSGSQFKPHHSSQTKFLIQTNQRFVQLSTPWPSHLQPFSSSILVRAECLFRCQFRLLPFQFASGSHVSLLSNLEQESVFIRAACDGSSIGHISFRSPSNEQPIESSRIIFYDSCFPVFHGLPFSLNSSIKLQDFGDFLTPCSKFRSLSENQSLIQFHHASSHSTSSASSSSYSERLPTISSSSCSSSMPLSTLFSINTPVLSLFHSEHLIRRIELLESVVPQPPCLEFETLAPQINSNNQTETSVVNLPSAFVAALVTALVSVSDICQSVGISPHQLERLFERSQEIIRFLRLSHQVFPHLLELVQIEIILAVSAIIFCDDWSKCQHLLSACCYQARLQTISLPAPTTQTDDLNSHTCAFTAQIEPSSAADTISINNFNSFCQCCHLTFILPLSSDLNSGVAAGRHRSALTQRLAVPRKQKSSRVTGAASNSLPSAHPLCPCFNHRLMQFYQTHIVPCLKSLISAHSSIITMFHSVELSNRWDAFQTFWQQLAYPQFRRGFPMLVNLYRSSFISPISIDTDLISQLKQMCDTHQLFVSPRLCQNLNTCICNCVVPPYCAEDISTLNMCIVVRSLADFLPLDDFFAVCELSSKPINISISDLAPIINELASLSFKYESCFLLFTIPSHYNSNRIVQHLFQSTLFRDFSQILTTSCLAQFPIHVKPLVICHDQLSDYLIQILTIHGFGIVPHSNVVPIRSCYRHCLPNQLLGGIKQRCGDCCPRFTEISPGWRLLLQSPVINPSWLQKAGYVSIPTFVSICSANRNILACRSVVELFLKNSRNCHSDGANQVNNDQKEQ